MRGYIVKPLRTGLFLQKVQTRCEALPLARPWRPPHPTTRSSNPSSPSRCYPCTSPPTPALSSTNLPGGPTAAAVRSASAGVFSTAADPFQDLIIYLMEFVGYWGRACWTRTASSATVTKVHIYIVTGSLQLSGFQIHGVQFMHAVYRVHKCKIISGDEQADD